MLTRDRGAPCRGDDLPRRGRLPRRAAALSVTYVATLDEDLCRRDFTMNAIALRSARGRAHRSVRRAGRSGAPAHPRRGRSGGALPRGRPAPDARRAPGRAAGVRDRSADARGDPADARRLPQGLGRARARRDLKLLAAPRPSRGPRADARDGPPRRGAARAARGRGLHAEPLPQARRLRAHAGRRRRDAAATPSCGWARCCTTSASRARASRARARPASTASSSTSTSAPTWPTRSAAAEAVQRRPRARRRDGRAPHVLLHARLDRRHRPPLRAARRRPRRWPRCSRCARATSRAAASARIPSASSASCAAHRRGRRRRRRAARDRSRHQRPATSCASSASARAARSA